MQQTKGTYHLDINSTSSCNMRCTYCFEHGHFDKKQKPSDELTKNIKEKIDYAISNKEFLINFDGFCINFWGGEPTLNQDFIEELINYYKENNRVHFFIYTNGYHFTERFIDFIKQFNGKTVITGEAKVFLQISYDGIASHDLDRIDVGGHGTALKVKENIFKLARENIPFTIQSTLAFKNFDKIKQNYDEFTRMNEMLSKIYNGKNRDFLYSPTLDYINSNDFDDEHLQQYKAVLKKQLLQITKQEIEYYNKNNMFFFNWLNPSKAICGAGAGLSALDIDGDVIVCHGALYTKDTEHVLTNVYKSKEEFTNDLLENFFKYSKERFILPDECKSCHAVNCMKCNVKKFELSKKDDYFDKWRDYTDQPQLCDTYKFLGSFRLSLMKIIKG